MRRLYRKYQDTSIIAQKKKGHLNHDIQKNQGKNGAMELSGMLKSTALGLREARSVLER
ncbi:MAG: hypothetical protein HQL03_14435 [Nitrospirae bacterium]|nr:hypothetical protein [Nitrospirota bacterium]